MRRHGIIVAGLGLCVGCQGDLFGLGEGGSSTTRGNDGTTTGLVPTMTSSTGGIVDSSGSTPATTSSSTSSSVGTSTSTGTGTETGMESGTTAPPDPSTTSTGTTEGTTGELPTLDCSDPALVACYDFDSVGGGMLEDLSGSGNTVAAVVAGVEIGPFGDAATFDANSMISVPDNETLELAAAMTYEAWIRVDALPAGAGARTGVVDNDGQYSLIILGSDAYRCATSNVEVVQGPVVVGQWSHVACVHNTAVPEVRLYVDGVEIDSLMSDGTVFTGNNNPMSIGDTSPSFDEPFLGAIGGLRIWNEGRTAQQICDAAGELCMP